MIWFHTVALPLATAFVCYLVLKRKAAVWRLFALALGCGLMLSGLWLEVEWSTLLLIGGGVLFFVGVPRGLVPKPRSS